jgi:outer membrane protein assembly factor BamD (BamD/ComL family)
VACSSGPPVIPDELTPLQFFQRAQEESEGEYWDNAIYYYQTLLERFPDDLENCVAARYEIAFTYYKKGNYEKALAGFQEVVDFYDDPNLPSTFLLWPKVMSLKLIKIVEDKLSPVFSLPGS